MFIQLIMWVNYSVHVLTFCVFAFFVDTYHVLLYAVCDHYGHGMYKEIC